MSFFEDYHRNIVTNSMRLAEAAACVGAGFSIGFTIGEGRSFSYFSDGSTIKIQEGEDADLLLHVKEAYFSEVIQEQHTLSGLFHIGHVSLLKGNILDCVRWEAPLEAIFYDRPIWTPTENKGIETYQPNRRFSLDDPLPEMADFLQKMGYIHLRGVFSADEVAAFQTEVEQCRTQAKLHDRSSWWAKNSQGEDICCRLIYLNRLSTKLAAFPQDERMLTIAALANADLKPAGDRMDGVNAVMKSYDIVEGMSDLPWHRDCGSGGHALICPGLIVGLQLDRANKDNGQLRFIPGTTAFTGPNMMAGEDGLPIVDIETEPGDVTAHFCHTLHQAPPPAAASANRRVLYCGYYRQALLDAVPLQQSYNDIVFDDNGDIGNHVRELF